VFASVFFSWRLPAVNMADKNVQMMSNPNYSAQSNGIADKFKILFDGYQKMFDQSLSKSRDLGDILRFLPGVVVQKTHSSKEGMADLYRIKPDLLERLIKSPIQPFSPHYYIKLDHYLSDFLEDRNRSQLYYCDPMLQHISICRRFLSLLNPSAGDASDLHWKS
jgi:hypothetical protein